MQAEESCVKSATVRLEANRLAFKIKVLICLVRRATVLSFGQMWCHVVRVSCVLSG